MPYSCDQRSAISGCLDHKRRLCASLTKGIDITSETDYHHAMKNSGTFQKGHKRSPESIEKQRQTILHQIKDGTRIVPKIEWTQDRIDKMVKKQRDIRMKWFPLGSKRKHRSSKGFYYWQIKISDRGKWKYEHRIVMEQKLKRLLNREEHVHHINRDTLDNRPENLIILSHSEHSFHHGKNRNFNPKFHRELLNGRWSIQHSECTLCHRTSVSHAAKGFCISCYSKNYQKK